MTEGDQVHAATPWCVVQDACNSLSIRTSAEGDRSEVASIYNGDGEITPTDEANACRIVACVNACAGWDPQSMRDAADEWQDEQEAAAQRDMLVDVLQAIERYADSVVIDGFDTPDETCHSIRERARAALKAVSP